MSIQRFTVNYPNAGQSIPVEVVTYADHVAEIERVRQRVDFSWEVHLNRMEAMRAAYIAAVDDVYGDTDGRPSYQAVIAALREVQP